MMQCPLCQSMNTSVVYTNENMPFGILQKESLLNLSISYCEACTFIFQSSAYTPEYDTNIQALYSKYYINDNYTFPNRNKQHLKAVDFLSSNIRNECSFNVLEIGSNRGDFLFLLKEKYPYINILGCEPTSFSNLEVPTINAFYDQKLFNSKFDLLILRHTLEHIKNPKTFLTQLENILKPNGVIFIEVPHIVNSLKNSIEDFTPDHVNYFTPQTLNQLFSDYGCINYDESSYLYMTFSKTAPHKDIVSATQEKALINNFKKQRETIKDALKNYSRVIFYGIGNFYLWTYAHLHKDLQDKKLFFLDDNKSEDRLFKLDKIASFEDNDLVILCSSNLEILKTMQQKLPPNVAVLHPWSHIIKARLHNGK